jgi:large subunit ribosomal protein L3
MSGHMGNAQRTIQGLKIVKVDVDRNLLLIKGALPGAKGGDVMIKPSVKASGN